MISSLQVADSSLPALPVVLLSPQRITQNCSKGGVRNSSGPGSPLVEVMRQGSALMMNRQVREAIDLFAAQGHHMRADLIVAVSSELAITRVVKEGVSQSAQPTELNKSLPCAVLAESVHQAHEFGKHQPDGHDLQRVVVQLFVNARDSEGAGILMASSRLATRRFTWSGRRALPSAQRGSRRVAPAPHTVCIVGITGQSPPLSLDLKWVSPDRQGTIRCTSPRKHGLRRKWPAVRPSRDHRRGQIQRLSQGNETNVGVLEFSERREQVRD